MYFKKTKPTAKESKKLPIDPEKVLLGLILVSLGPLKTFPNIKPPISVEIQINIKKRKK